MSEPTIAKASRTPGPDMNDVARHAGVSPQTVSRTLNGYPHVSAKAREKVLAAVAELGYRRNRAAAALASGRTKSIGVVTFAQGSFRFDVATGIIAEAERAGYTVNINVTASDSPSDIAHAMSRLLDQSVAGIVLALPLGETNEELDAVMAEVPTIATGSQRQEWLDAIAIDSAAGTRLAVDHLLSLGHETVWYLAGSEAPLLTAAWRAALDEAGRTIPDVLQGDWTGESGYANGLLLAQIPEATAVFVAGDEMAFGVLRALHDSGVRVPDDISVVGSDDHRLSRWAIPGLTTVHHPFDIIGERAVRYLLHQLDAPEEGPFTSEWILPEIILRDSAAAPSSRPGPRQA